MLCIETAAAAPLTDAINTTAATLFVRHSRSAKKIVLTVAAAFIPIMDPVFDPRCEAIGLASRAPAFIARDVL